MYADRCGATAMMSSSYAYAACVALCAVLHSHAVLCLEGLFC